MDGVELAFQVPMAFRVLCYLSAMGLFLAENIWLFRYAYGYGNVYSLKGICKLWLVRILVACVLLSLAGIVFYQREMQSVTTALPELLILFLVSALYLLAVKERPLPWKYIIERSLPRGLLMAFVAVLACCVLWVLAFALGWFTLWVFPAFGLPVWVPFFIIGLLWNAPLVFLFLKIGQRGQVEGLKLHDLLWPVLLAYLLVMLPDIFEYVGNHPNVELMMEAKQTLVRA